MILIEKQKNFSISYRQERGTLWTGRFYEGPTAPGSLTPSDYTPGNTFDRLAHVREPFSEKEWAEKKKYRSFDILYCTYGVFGLFFLYRLNGDWPTVWC